ncbi:hypothetical protein OHB05_42240 [Streptomyces sp. NBC_00638]|uniref:hypothetical protein n=1 Tax=Streptomyces sp. NBC_00638 TaxID=2975794 RepID=UPI00225412B8|nr:hypothetical protein [Streptomyces sp. NBC_00638]MCX5009140.1 hypothetical protein [Streptomyces sp. NBC_00638]
MPTFGISIRRQFDDQAPRQLTAQAAEDAGRTGHPRLRAPGKPTKRFTASTSTMGITPFFGELTAEDAAAHGGALAPPATTSTS